MKHDTCYSTAVTANWAEVMLHLNLCSKLLKCPADGLRFYYIEESKCYVQLYLHTCCWNLHLGHLGIFIAAWSLIFVSWQIARKRHKVINTFKSPMGQTRPPPSLKHIALMPLSQIRRVLDLQDTEGDGMRAFTSVPWQVYTRHFNWSNSKRFHTPWWGWMMEVLYICCCGLFSRMCECFCFGGSSSNWTGELAVQLPADWRGNS